MANENFKYAYFALIKANIDNEYNEAMLQFILYVIKKKHYDEIDVETLCKDFEKNYWVCNTILSNEKIIN